MTRTPRLLLAFTVTAAALTLAPASALGATTLFAEPFGSGSACTEKNPCTIYKAVEEVSANGDSVSLAPGKYELLSGLSIHKELSVGGAIGGAASTVLNAAANVHEDLGAKATLHDVTVEGVGGLSISDGLGERVFVSYTGNASSGCTLHSGSSLRDSVCWAHDGGGGSSALRVEAGGGKGTVTLASVTAIDVNSSATAIYAEGSGAGGALTLNGTNVIARGSNHPDVEAITNGGGVSSVVNLTHSNYATILQEPPAEVVTAPGTNGNQTAAPAFVDAALGDFHELASSPTVGAGLVEPLIGSFDLNGRPRTQPGCPGAVLTDIGAYQLPGQVFSCPVAVENRFRFGKQRLNRKKGTATLIAIVPGSGALKLSGKGLKAETLTAKGAGSVKLSIVPVGKAKKGLAKTGKRKVAPKVTFTPTGGSPYSQAHSMTLRKRLG